MKVSFQRAFPIPTIENTPGHALAAKTVRSVSIGVLIYAVPFFAIEIPFFAVRKFAGSVLFLSVVIGALLSLFFLRKGNLSLANWIFLSPVWVFVVTLTAFSGGISSPGLLIFVPVVILTAWILGAVAAWVFTAVCVLLTLAMALLQNAGVHVPKYFPAPPISTWIVMLLFVVIATVPLCQVLRSFSEALASEHRQTMKLRESEERFRSMADTATVMIAVTGPDNLGSFFNKAWLEFRGRTMEQELGNGWTEALDPDDRDAFLAKYSDRLEHLKFECRLRRANGELRWLLCSGAPRFEPGGVFAGYVTSAVDITDFKRAQEESFDRQKLESLGTLASGIAHDFNNLLAAVLAQSELALAELPAGSQAEEQLKGIADAAVKGSEIVRQLMIYAGKEAEVLDVLNVSQTIREMLPLLRISVPKHAALEADLDEDLPPVQANAAQIRQLVMNLVMNASEAIADRDGAIRVATRCVTLGPDSSWVSPGVLRPGDYVRLEVSDTGRGIPSELQASVFNPFFTTKSAGRGLGLAIVNRIVRTLDGAIRLESEPGKGTTFEILLPSAEVVGGPAHSGISRLSKPAGPSRAGILVVEDEDLLRRAISGLLRKAGFSVFEASDGSAALQLIQTRANTIDVLLLDITLPGTPSRDVFAQARRLRPEMKVIITSAYTEDFAAEILQANIDSFVRKPYRIADLVDLLRRKLA